VVLQDPVQVALVRPEGLLRFGGWNRLPSHWRLEPLNSRSKRGLLPGREKQA